MPINPSTAVANPGVRLPLPMVATYQPGVAEATALEVMFIPHSGHTRFALAPLQTRFPAARSVERETVEWHLARDTAAQPITMQLRLWQRTGAGQWNAIDIPGPSSSGGMFPFGSGPLRLDLGEEDGAAGPVSASVTRYFSLLRHAIVVPIHQVAPNLPDGPARRFLRSLWPTGVLNDLRYLILEPSGLYAAGRLPDALFPPGATPQPVVLRVPHNGTPTARQTNADALPPPTEPWLLGAYRFGELAHLSGFEHRTTSVDFVLSHAERLDAFRRGNAAAAVGTFVDVKSRPGRDCTVEITRVSDAELRWVARNPETTIIVGTLNSPEAHFHPVAVGSRLERQANAWRATPVVWDSHGQPFAAVDVNAGTAFTIGLRHQGADDLSVGLNESLVAVGLPTRPAAGRSGRQAWLCTEDGWLSADDVVEAPSTRGGGTGRVPLVGELDVGRMYRDLAAAETTDLGLRLTVAAQPDSVVRVEASPN